MGKSTISSSSEVSHVSSRESTFSRMSQRTYETNLTSHHNIRPSIKQYDTEPVFQQIQSQKHQAFLTQGSSRSSTSSVDTYASTQASEDDLPSLSLNEFPRERYQCFDPDATPSTPADFAELFPSCRRIMIQHDDSTTDGNMNLRVDTDVTTKSGRRRKLTLFHMKIQDIVDRKFSVRRYWRNSGREVASSRRKYMHPLPTALTKPSLRRSSTAPEFIKSTPWRQDSGYESDEDEDDFKEKFRAFTIANNIKATVPTSSIRLEFSNYAQVVIDPDQSSDRKNYNFEYWGVHYSWKRRLLRDGSEIITSYELVNLITQEKVASIVPDALSAEEVEFETSQGAWIPASSMRILQKDISDDLGDVIVTTGLIVLTDDCIPH